MSKFYVLRKALNHKSNALWRLPLMVSGGIMMLIFLVSLNAKAQLTTIVENFDYAAGTTLTSVGYTAASGGGTNAITVTTPGLTYTGYAGSGIGNCVSLNTSGEDDLLNSSTYSTSGFVYLAAIVNVSAAQATGDYFLCMQSGTTSFAARIFAKSTTGGFLFGAAKGNAGTLYETTVRTFNTSYLIVAKYIFDATNTDTVKFWVNPAIGGPEPTPTITNLIGGSDLADIKGFLLRQGSSTAAATVKVDGIRQAVDWATAVAPVANVPILNVNPSILNGFSYLPGSGPSVSQSYSLSGQYLTGFPGNITVTGTTDFEVSTDNNIFATSVNVPYTSETLSATTVYVRLKSGLSIGYYFNENITNAGGGATTVNVTCNGAVVLPEPTNHATNFLAGTPTTLTIPLTWTDATGGTVPDGYLIKASTTGFDAITPPVDLVPETDGTYIKNVAAGVGTVTFTGLQPNQTHYFKIWPYTNTGTYVNYKLDGTVPQQSATTVMLNFRSAASGAWNAAATWEISYDNNTWNPATTEIPVYRTSDVTIKSGHLVNVPLSYNTGSAKNLTVENGATLYANSATGSCFVYVFGDFLNNGTVGGATDVIGFDIEGTSCNMSGTGSFIASRMAKFTNTNATTNLTINQNVTLTYTSTTNFALYNNVPATTMFNITLDAGKNLTVNNANINTSGCTLTLISNNTGTASLIAKGMSGSGTTTVQRYISGWTNASHGWHLISSPVASQAIAPAFTDPTPANYDFYKWDEVTNQWLNQKVGANNITTFVPGTGYLVAYQGTGTKQFTGTLNTANVTNSTITLTGGTYSGWNLIGNPFSCALKWNDGTNWTVPPEIAQIAKIWNEPTAAYVDIAQNGFIPAMNGFMVQLTTGTTASLTIPIAARVHDATPWYKATDGKLILVAYDREYSTEQQCVIGVNSQATEGYDASCDSRFLAGYAPQFYSIAGEEILSTNTLPGLDESRTIELGFVKNEGVEFSIGLNPESAIPGLAVYLTDKKTGAVTELKQNVEYSFTSTEGDDASRFLLHFGPLGIDDPASTGTFRIYASSGNIYILSQQPEKADVTVSNILGQVAMRSQAEGNSLNTLNAWNLQNGIYVVSITSGNQTVSQKILLNR